MDGFLHIGCRVLGLEFRMCLTGRDAACSVRLVTFNLLADAARRVPTVGCSVFRFRFQFSVYSVPLRQVGRGAKRRRGWKVFRFQFSVFRFQISVLIHPLPTAWDSPCLRGRKRERTFPFSAFTFPFSLLTVCLDYQFAEEAVGPCEP